MHNYEDVVKVIELVTNLKVPVYYDNAEANCSGSPYFGVGKHIYDICDEEILFNPMVDPIDFIENKYIQYYHIGLPNKIIRHGDEHIYRIIEEQLNKAGIKMKLTETLLETFIILHEFGHAHQLFIQYNKNVEKYLTEMSQEKEYNRYIIQTKGLAGTARGLRIHKSLSTEKYADKFAIKHFRNIINRLEGYQNEESI